MIKLYFNPRCKKCNLAREKLDNKKACYVICEYLTENIKLSDIKEILDKGNFEPEDIVRKNEQEYKELIAGKFLSDREIIGLILTHPTLLQRPIIVTENSAFIARDDEWLRRIK